MQMISMWSLTNRQTEEQREEQERRCSWMTRGTGEFTEKWALLLWHFDTFTRFALSFKHLKTWALLGVGALPIKFEKKKGENVIVYRFCVASACTRRLFERTCQRGAIQPIVFKNKDDKQVVHSWFTTFLVTSTPKFCFTSQLYLTLSFR